MQEEKKKSRKEGDKARLAAAAARLGVLQRRLKDEKIPVIITFDGFDAEKVCVYKEEKLEALRKDPGIIRNRLKIQAAVTNAQAFREIQKEYGSFSEYLWHWTEGSVIRETGKTSSELSDAISKDLKKQGMKFVGTTVVYAYLQAVGVIWSHEDECFCRQEDEI